eukprot:COSAG02_NODE_7301_length_3076_cov_1.645616_2_plen_160_part_00
MAPPSAVVVTHLCVARRGSLEGLRSNANRFVALHALTPSTHRVTLGVCGRVTEIGQNRNMGGTSKGVCLQINATAPNGGATWQLEENGTKILVSGQCTDCDLSKWLPLALDFTADSKVTATVNGKTMDPVDTRVTAGMISLTTGWHVGEFDNFALSSSV